MIKLTLLVYMILIFSVGMIMLGINLAQNLFG